MSDRSIRPPPAPRPPTAPSAPPAPHASPAPPPPVAAQPPPPPPPPHPSFMFEEMMNGNFPFGPHGGPPNFNGWYNSFYSPHGPPGHGPHHHGPPSPPPPPPPGRGRGGRSRHGRRGHGHHHDRDSSGDSDGDDDLVGLLNRLRAMGGGPLPDFVSRRDRRRARREQEREAERQAQRAEAEAERAEEQAERAEERAERAEEEAERAKEREGESTSEDFVNVESDARRALADADRQNFAAAEMAARHREHDRHHGLHAHGRDAHHAGPGGPGGPQWHAPPGRPRARPFGSPFPPPPPHHFGHGHARPSEPFPRVDIFASASQYVLEAELPGVRKEDITALVVSEDGLSVSIEGTVPARAEGSLERVQTERWSCMSGPFARTVWLPGTVNKESVRARLADGVLVVTLDKPTPGGAQGTPVVIE